MTKAVELARFVLGGYYPTRSELRLLASTVIGDDDAHAPIFDLRTIRLERARPMTFTALPNPRTQKWDLLRGGSILPLKRAIGRTWAWGEAHRRARNVRGTAILLDYDGSVIDRKAYASNGETT